MLGEEVGFLALYFIPSIVGFIRKHRNRAPILVINIGTGWTMIGWIICLAWAVSPNVEDKDFKFE